MNRAPKEMTRPGRGRGGMGAVGNQDAAAGPGRRRTPPQGLSYRVRTPAPVMRSAARSASACPAWSNG